MSTPKTVLYTGHVAELTDIYDLPITNPPNSPDWGLTTKTDTIVNIAFVYSDETITIGRETYNELIEKLDYTKEITVTDPSKHVRTIGADAIIDLHRGEPPLDGLENALPRAMANVFAMQAEHNERHWPNNPDNNEQTTGTVVCLDYSDPSKTTPCWWIPTTNVSEARLRVREHVASKLGLDNRGVNTVVGNEQVPKPDDIPSLPEES